MKIQKKKIRGGGGGGGGGSVAEGVRWGVGLVEVQGGRVSWGGQGGEGGEGSGLGVRVDVNEELKFL